MKLLSASDDSGRSARDPRNSGAVVRGAAAPRTRVVLSAAGRRTESRGPGVTERQTRVEKAAGTRRRVLEQARDLFVLQGFAATSTRQVAAAAGVTERTVFNIVPTKSDLLREVVLLSIFGDGDRDVAMVDREDFAGVRRSATPEQLLREFAGWVLRLHRRSSVFAEMVRSAGAVDPGAAEIWRWGNARQVTDCQRLLTLMCQRGWLVASHADNGTAISLAVLTGHETYWRLVIQQHYTAPRYKRWLVLHMAAELLDTDTRENQAVPD